MSCLPKNTEFGVLKMIKVYDYYDCPRLFLCRNVSDQNFIGLSVKDEKDKMTWLYAKISEERLEKAEAGEIDLRDIFKKAEECVVFGVETHGEGPDILFKVPCEIIPEKYLPEKGCNLISEKKNDE